MKLVLKIGAILLIVLVIAVVVLSLSLNSVIKTGIETMGPQITGTPVTLQQANLSLLSGQSQLEGLLVGNPKGFHTDHALKLGLVRVTADLSSAFSDTLVIEEILIEGPEIIFEGNLSSSNIQQIRKHVETYSSSGQKEPGGEEEPTSSKRKVEIHHLTIKNAKVKLSMSFLKGRGLAIPLPDIHLQDIGKKTSGATWHEITAQVLDRLESTILQLVPDSGKYLERGLKKMGESLKKLGSPTTEEAVSDVFKGIKGMLEKEE